jgi:hypothetical protein
MCAEVVGTRAANVETLHGVTPAETSARTLRVATEVWRLLLILGLFLHGRF